MAYAQYPNVEGAEHIVIGGGISGLTAALILARAGQQVTLIEKARRVGGRATSRTQGGYIFNQGPHALYTDGAAHKTLRELGIHVVGRKPQVTTYTRHNGKIVTLAYSPLELLNIQYLTWPQKWQLTRFLLSFTTGQSPDPGQSVQEWIENSIQDPLVRSIVYTAVRVATYANAPHMQSAAAAYTQMQLAQSGGVLYLDGGWQTIVDGLRDAATAGGVQIHTGVRVEQITRQGQVRFKDGTTRAPATVLLAVDPQNAAGLLTDLTPAEHHALLPAGPAVRVATLDLALATLPDPDHLFALGIDAPLYYSVHSATARLAPQGAALVHVARYLEGDVSGNVDDARDFRSELELFVDEIQPGWRNHIVHERYLPDMVVSHALHVAGKPRFGRSNTEVPGHQNVFVAGDWVGESGMLADAAIASATLAAQRALELKPNRAPALYVQAEAKTPVLVYTP